MAGRGAAGSSFREMYRAALPLLVSCSAVAPADPCAQTGEQLVATRCTSCHARSATLDQRQGATLGVDFDTRADQQRWAERIRVRTVVDKTMPPTGPLPDCELSAVDAWVTQLKQSPCEPACGGRTCGDDGCGGTCGSCSGALVCSTAGTCQCQASCSGKQCGDDGCGGSCGQCPVTASTCTSAGQCTCTPSCAGRMCGGDGCGGSCGACSGALVCNTNTGRCGASCTPSCTGRACGDDGCGGSCGTCPSGQTCTAATGTCAGAATSYATDVYPVFRSCGSGMGCHAGARPADGLDFSTASGSYAQLVGIASQQCSNRIRVVRNDVAASYLVNKLTGVGMCQGSRMPKGGALTAAELDLVRAWITSGANP